MSAVPVSDFPSTGGTLPQPALRDPARQLLAMMCAQAVATATTSVSVPVRARWPILFRDPATTGVWIGDIDAVVLSNAPKVLDEIKTSSGLTWEQIARMMGVSRRTIHLWLQGNRLGSTNEERLHSIAHIVRLLGRRSQLEVRSLMLDKTGGTSIVDLLAEGDDAAALRLAQKRALSQAAPAMFEHVPSAQSRDVGDFRRGAISAMDLLETGSGPVQATAGRPKHARRIKRRAADGR